MNDESWAYVNEMDCRLRDALEKRNYLYAFVLATWRRAALYGSSARRTLIWGAIIIVGFALAYYPNPWGWGFVRLQCDCQLHAHRILQALYFSVVTFVTLGFGDIHPVNTWGMIAVMSESVLGFVTLGVMVTLISRRFMH